MPSYAFLCYASMRYYTMLSTNHHQPPTPPLHNLPPPTTSLHHPSTTSDDKCCQQLASSNIISLLYQVQYNTQQNTTKHNSIRPSPGPVTTHPPSNYPLPYSLSSILCFPSSPCSLLTQHYHVPPTLSLLTHPSTPSTCSPCCMAVCMYVCMYVCMAVICNV